MVNVASLRMLCFVFFPRLLSLPASSPRLGLAVGVVLAVVVPFALPCRAVLVVVLLFAVLAPFFLVGVGLVAPLS